MTVSELVDMMPIGCTLVLIDLKDRPFMRCQKVTESGCICTPAKTYPANNPHESFKCRIIALRVFPVKQNKAPYIKGGVNSASDDPAQVRAWWAQWPNANIGIATGNASRGLIVIDLDVDPEKGIDGRESLRAWEAQHGALPATLCSITGRGGNHLLYYSMQRVRNRAGVLPGVDVRLDKGGGDGVDGDAVRYLQGIFLTMWNRETGQHIGGPAYFPDTPQLPDSIAEEIMIVDRTPRERPRSISRAYAASIREADSLIRIVNPYFVPTKSIKEAIKYALKKGTEVEIMVPSVSDVPFTPEAAFYILHKLMKKGAKVHLFNGGFHHSKVMMVDGSFCTVGTANLNSRSLRYDYETNAFIFDPETTAELTEMFNRDKQNSTLMTPEYWKERSAWKKFVGWFAHLFTPFL